MAAAPWNRVNIPFPAAVSCVRVPFTSTSACKVKSVCAGNETVLKLVRCEVLQTEVRVLYELLHVLHNSFRANKTLQALRQVEQCVNRLKMMRLEDALQELADLCPNKAQRGLGLKTGECSVPSQPTLEWTCLKVLGAADLLSCCLQRCSRAFLLSRQQLRCEEFIVLNVVITSMLSRLWVIFRGMLSGLSALYPPLLVLLGDVSRARPMPYLAQNSLPADMTATPGPSRSVLPRKHPTVGAAQQTRGQQSGKKASWRRREDLGVAVERDLENHTDIKPCFNIFRKAKPLQEEKELTFRKQLREARSFACLSAHLQDMIVWFKSHRMQREKRLLTFLHLKCLKMKCLEAAGHDVHRKLRFLRQEVSWASSPPGSMRKRLHFCAVIWRRRRARSLLGSRRGRRLSGGGGRRKAPTVKPRKTAVTELNRDEQQSRPELPLQTTGSHDDIDAIFASVGL
uniref:Nucleolus and neural progenitor protein-like N-terminal domain-containing protein n=1 Tax=Oryzias latipes TaxID=8090 RepID=A0A3P9HBY7_ORYLA